MRSADASNRPIVGSSQSIGEMCEIIEALARHDCTVLIQGESGTGKELAARQIHARSRRANGPFVAVDCTTLRDTLLESQLFGHIRGAFTGAQRATLGFFRAAEGGTIFLDEIGELEPAMQAKLLRCIQDRAVIPLGSTTPISVNVRIIVATHRNLSDMVTRGQFREDLFYRLNVACLHVPPLRERLDDVPELARRAAKEFCALDGRPTVQIAPDALETLCAYQWPGNVRELINAIEHALVFSKGDEIRLEDLPASTRRRAPGAAAADERPMTLAEVECDLIRRTLRITNGNQSHAATLLAIERHRLHRRIVRYGLQDLVRAGSCEMPATRRGLGTNRSTGSKHASGKRL